MHKLRRWDMRERRKLLQQADLERVGRLPPEAKVNMAIDMTDATVRACAEGIRAQNPDVTEEELMKKLRERFEWAKRRQKRDGPVE